MAADRDEEILRAAEKLFYERGFTAVTMADIGKRAGMVASGIYRYFGSKEEILGELLSRTAEMMLIRAGQPHQDPAIDLRLLATAHLESSIDHHRLVSIWTLDGRSLSGSQLRSFRRREHRYAERWLDALARRFPGVAPADLRTLLRGLWALLMSDAQQPAGGRSTLEGQQLLLGIAHGGLDVLAATGADSAPS
jgi:AcrR family transcriptional regulator